MTEVLPCSCKHEYQDAKYGHGKRVHNELSAKSAKGTHRCTVCGVAKTLTKVSKKK